MFLNLRNIIIFRSFKKLNNEMLKFFRILVVINAAYQLKLLLIMKIYNVFALNLLQLNFADSLKEQ
jgi:hypothetical protein